MTGFAIFGIIVFALIVLTCVGFLVASLPEMQRYLRILKM
ncbi:MAG: DUF6893 family small protein [Gammaproteobacteria bacterium]